MAYTNPVMGCVVGVHPGITVLGAGIVALAYPLGFKPVFCLYT